MLSAILSFLGGSAFRMIFGEVSDWLKAKQDQAFEIQRLEIQARLEGEQHARNLESIRVQHELGVEVIRVQAAGDVARIEAAAWESAVSSAMRPTGITFVDVWNGVIRPLCATIAVLLWVLALNEQGWKMSEWDKELVGVVLGFFFASREMLKRNK